MSKELKKFEADYKKMTPAIKLCTQAEADKHLHKNRQAMAQAVEGHAHFRESMAKARENGVTGDKMADFAKDKDFKSALSAWQAAVKAQAEEIKVGLYFYVVSKGAQKAMIDLHARILKDLKSRGKISRSKKDIEKLRDTLAKEIEVVKAVLKSESKLDGRMRSYGKKFPQLVDATFKEAAKFHAKLKDATELPQLLQDRVRHRNAKKAVQMAKAVAKLCGNAITKAESDIDTAKPVLKAASAQVQELKKINDGYQKVKKQFMRMIDASKDKKKLLEVINLIAKAFAAAERTLRGAITTIKNAT